MIENLPKMSDTYESFFGDVCRLCAIDFETGMNIYGNEGRDYNLEQKILSCLRIEVSKDDLLPKKVCYDCSNQLEQLHQFSLRAGNAQQTLSFLLDLKMKQLKQSDVKEEQSLIKNEMEDLVISNCLSGTHADFQDFVGISLNEVLSEETSLESIVRVAEVLPPQLSPKIPVESRGNHRRKMLNPKKSAENEISNETDLFQDLVEISERTDKKEDLDQIKLSFDDEIEFGLDLHLKCLCGEFFGARADFEVHYVDKHHAPPIYACALCQCSVDNFHAYFDHLSSHNNSYKCIFCGRGFGFIQGLRVHIKSKHQPGATFDSKKPKQTEYRCDQCGKQLKTRHSLVAHVLEHANGRQFMCHLCGKTFAQKINMQQHVKHHRGERPFVCDLCPKTFAENSHLRRHRKFHSAERPFQCKVCQKCYKTERCLKVHAKVHETTRRFICNECGKGFIRSSKLKEHSYCHTGERPFACKYCERTFTNYPNWLKHTRRKHKVDHKTGMKLEQMEDNKQAITPDLIKQVEEELINRNSNEYVMIKEPNNESVSSFNFYLDATDNSNQNSVVDFLDVPY